MIHRRPTWEADLAAALAEAEARPFAWGAHDCVSAACRLAGAAMGRDLLGFVRVRWDERRARILLDTFGGMAGWLHVVGTMNGLTTVRPEHAPRGALVLVRQPDGSLAAGCLLGARIAVVDQQGFATVPARLAEAAWSD